MTDLSVIAKFNPPPYPSSAAVVVKPRCTHILIYWTNRTNNTQTYIPTQQGSVYSIILASDSLKFRCRSTYNHWEFHNRSFPFFFFCCQCLLAHVTNRINQCRNYFGAFAVTRTDCSLSDSIHFCFIFNSAFSLSDVSIKVEGSWLNVG